MRRNVEEKIANIVRQISGNGTPAAAPSQTGRRSLSPAARRRIAAAQSKRWAAVKGEACEVDRREAYDESIGKIATAQQKRWALLKAKKVADPTPWRPIGPWEQMA
jgi:hypothetical protein